MAVQVGKRMGKGRIAYLARSIHPVGYRRSLQQFVRTEGRGPYLDKIDVRQLLHGIKPIWKPNCAVNSKPPAQHDGFDAYNHLMHTII
jgi:hypothetical protein